MAAERDLVTGVIQLSNLFIRRLTPLFEKAKITPQQWIVLATLAGESAPVTLVGLARRLMVSKQNMTGMIARLDQLGLAERQGDPNDLRSSRVTLTRRGRTLVEKLRPAYEQWIRSLGDERESQSIMKTIERLIAELEGR